MTKLNINDLYGDKDFIMSCPNCLQIISVKLREVLAIDNIIVCPDCNSLIEINKNESIKSTINELHKIIGDIETNIK